MITILEGDSFRTPSLGKQQNKKVLEEDGIKCFDLEHQSLNEDLRLSIGLPNLPANFTMGAVTSDGTSLNLNDQLKMWQELEKTKREIDSLQSYVDKLEKEKMTYESDRGKIFLNNLTYLSYRKPFSLERRI
jgi:hypothetical protein